ncbi:hypothetical protein CIW54_02090 [Paraburkholderia sp. T12-10]|nr:hypothetical protein CIW54_02090 [Paraburkholderia sp. T12-10]
MTESSRLPFMLAVGATGTALSLSILAGWQRGGTLPERVVWVAIGVVLVVSAHLLPALLRESPLVVRGIGSVLWIACLATACYGHATFFLLAQQHAGNRRVATAVIPPAPAHSLTVVMAERAVVVRQLEWANARHCSRDCARLAARRTTLTARLDALNAEADDVRRIEARRDRLTLRDDALRADPVTSRLAALLGTTVARVDLLSGLAFAAILEGTACLMWTIALLSSPLPASVAAVTDEVPTTVVAPVENTAHATPQSIGTVAVSHSDETVSRESVTRGHPAPTDSHAPRDDPITATPNESPDIAQLVQAVEAGRIRPTVAEIRRYLGCSQSRAIALRRQLAERSVAA